MDIGRVSASYFNGIIDGVRIYNRTLSADKIVRLYKIGGTFKADTTISNDSLTQGLVGHWTFDGKDMSGVQAYDRSGHGNWGTLITVQPVSPANSATPCSLTGPMTWYLANTFTFFVDGVGGSGTWYAPANTVKFNQWQHIVVEYDRSSGSNDPFFFYNGSQVSATQTAAPGTPKCDDSAIPKHIGDEGVAGGFAFDGTIDDVRIYNRFLTVHEIKRLYTMGR